MCRRDHRSCYNRSVSELLGQPCNKSDIPVKFIASCQQVFVKKFMKKNTKESVKEFA